MKKKGTPLKVIITESQLNEIIDFTKNELENENSKR